MKKKKKLKIILSISIIAIFLILGSSYIWLKLKQHDVTIEGKLYMNYCMNFIITEHS